MSSRLHVMVLFSSQKYPSLPPEYLPLYGVNGGVWSQRRVMLAVGEPTHRHHTGQLVVDVAYPLVNMPIMSWWLSAITHNYCGWLLCLQKSSTRLRTAGSTHSGRDLGMGSANERRRYIVTSSLIGWAHTQNDPCKTCTNKYLLTILRFQTCLQGSTPVVIHILLLCIPWSGDKCFDSHSVALYPLVRR